MRTATGQRDLRAVLEAKRDAMAAVATAHLTPDKLIKIVGVAMSRDPKLMECTPMSILNACMTLAELGLAPSTLGSAYLIPFENTKTGNCEAQLIIGYRGLVELARRSGSISTIQAEVVREGDVWELEYGLTPKLRHIPLAGPDARILHVYALVRFKDGSYQVTAMTEEEVQAVRRRSRAWKSGPWVTDFAEMAKKTVLRRICKLLPLTPEVEQQVALVDRTEFDLGRFADEQGPTLGVGQARGLTAAERRSSSAVAVPGASPEPTDAAPAEPADDNARMDADLAAWQGGGEEEQAEPAPEPEPAKKTARTVRPARADAPPAAPTVAQHRLAAIRRALDNEWVPRDEFVDQWGDPSTLDDATAVQAIQWMAKRQAVQP